jgi:hypothetical protein
MSGDQRRQHARLFRPDPEEFAPARAVLDARGLVLSDYLRATLVWLAANPDEALATLAAHWPVPRRLGRPPREVDDPGPVEQGAD